MDFITRKLSGNFITRKIEPCLHQIAEGDERGGGDADGAEDFCTPLRILHTAGGAAGNLASSKRDLSNVPFPEVKLYTLNPESCIINPTPYTLHPTPYTLHPTPYTLHFSPYTLHPTPSPLNPQPETLDLIKVKASVKILINCFLAKLTFFLIFFFILEPRVE